jgi:hypothetical protein
LRVLGQQVRVWLWFLSKDIPRKAHCSSPSQCRMSAMFEDPEGNPDCPAVPAQGENSAKPRSISNGSIKL